LCWWKTRSASSMAQAGRLEVPSHADGLAKEPAYFWQVAPKRNATRWWTNGSTMHCRVPRSLFVSCMVALLGREHMSELVCELIISLDGFARGQRSPA